MLRILLILLIFSTILYSVKAQTISGYIKDKASKEPLIGANIFNSLTGIGTTTNNLGYFTISVKQISTLKISYIGYQMDSILVNQDTIVNIELTPQTFQEITVSAHKENRQRPMGEVNITLEALENTPHLFGEKDVLKAMQTLPGVSNGVEGTSGLIVRGGTMDQNLILVDDAIVYNPSHLLGFLSSVNPDALKDMKFYKGGFPARYGGRLSAVVDLTMKEGDKKNYQSSFNLGLISSKYFIEGSIQPEKSSFLVSARASYLGLFLLPQRLNFNNGTRENYFNYWLYDISGKASFDLPQNAKLYGSFYNSSDRFTVIEGNPDDATTVGLNWANTLLSAKYAQPIGRNLFGNFTLNYSKYQLKTNHENSDIEFVLTSNIQDISFKADIDAAVTNQYKMKIGLNTIYHSYLPTKIEADNELHEVRLDAWEGAFFIENQWNINPKLQSNIGLRYSFYQTENEIYTSPEPRIALQYRLNTTTRIEAAYAKMTQYNHTLSNGNGGLPTDIWLPSTGRIPPQDAQHYTLELQHQANKWTGGIGFFYKKMKNLIDYKSGGNIVFAINEDWQDEVATEGIGESYGMEFFVQKQKGKWTGWLGYTLAWSNRKFENFNQNSWYPFQYDRRHELEWTLQYSFDNKKMKNLNCSWVYQSGIALTTPVAYYLNSTDDLVPLYTQKTIAEAPNYHRLDVNYNRSKKTKKGNIRTWHFGVYNLYGRQNPFYIDFRSYPIFENPVDFTTPIIGQQNFVEQGTLFSILPYISYELKF